ncbi:hypothetical protein ANN_17169, partial [Periplaneta americana]
LPRFLHESLSSVRPVYVIDVYKLTPSNGPKERSRRARDLTVALDNLIAIEFRPGDFFFNVEPVIRNEATHRKISVSWEIGGKRPLGRPRRRREDNIQMDLREVGYDDRDWINLAQYRDQWRAYVRAAMNLRLQNLSTQTKCYFEKDERDSKRTRMTSRDSKDKCNEHSERERQLVLFISDGVPVKYRFTDFALRIKAASSTSECSLSLSLSLNDGQTDRSFQTRYKEHITVITKLQNTSTYAEHITNANHTYRDINTDMEILHIQPKSQKLNTLEQYETYRHTKTHPNEILNIKLNFRTHTLFDSTLYYTNTPSQETKQEAPRPTTTSSEDDPKKVETCKPAPRNPFPEYEYPRKLSTTNYVTFLTANSITARKGLEPWSPGWKTSTLAPQSCPVGLS